MFGRFFKKNQDGVTRADLGQESSMYYCPEKKRWRERGKEHLEEEEKEVAPPPKMGEVVKEEKKEPEEPATGVGALLATPNMHRTLRKAPPTSNPGGGNEGPSMPPPMSIGGPFGGTVVQQANPNAPRGAIGGPFGGGATLPSNPNAPRNRDPKERRERPKPAPPAARSSAFGGVGGPAYTAFPGIQPPGKGGLAGVLPPGVMPPGVLPPGAKPPEPEPTAEELEKPDGDPEGVEAESSKQVDAVDPEGDPEGASKDELAPEVSSRDKVDPVTDDNDPEGFANDTIDPEGSTANIVDESRHQPSDNIDPEGLGSDPEGPTSVLHQQSERFDPEGFANNGMDPEGSTTKLLEAEDTQPEVPKADFDNVFADMETTPDEKAVVENAETAVVEESIEEIDNSPKVEDAPTTKELSPNENDNNGWVDDFDIDVGDVQPDPPVAVVQEAVPEELPEVPLAKEEVQTEVKTAVEVTDDNGWGDFDDDWGEDTPAPNDIAPIEEIAKNTGAVTQEPSCSGNGESISSWVDVGEEEEYALTPPNPMLQEVAKKHEKEDNDEQVKEVAETNEDVDETMKEDEDEQVKEVTDNKEDVGATMEKEVEDEVKEVPEQKEDDHEQTVKECEHEKMEATEEPISSTQTAPQASEEPTSSEQMPPQEVTETNEDVDETMKEDEEEKVKEVTDRKEDVGVTMEKEAEDEVKEIEPPIAISQELEALKEENAKLKRDIADSEAARSDLDAKVNQLELDKVQLTSDNSRMRSEVETFQAAENNLSSELTSRAQALKFRDDEIQSLTSKLQDSEARLVEALETTPNTGAASRVEELEEALKEAQRKLADTEERLVTALTAVPTRVSTPGAELDARSPDRTSDTFNLPDFVWNCGNSQVMQYVEKLLSDNAELKRQAANAPTSVDESGVLKEFATTSQNFDAKDTDAEVALAFASSISDCDGHQIQPLLALLVSHADNAEVCFKVCEALETLTFTDAENRQTIVTNDGLEKILSVMEKHQDVDAALIRPAGGALWNLTFDDVAVDRMTESAGLLERFFAVIVNRKEAADLQAGACAVLLNLAVKEQTRWKIVQLDGIAHMVAAMKQHSQCEEVLEQGCQALYMLAYHQEFKPLVQSKCGDAASLAASFPDGARAQKWGRWLQEVLAC